ncbi:GbsR/MarR family transcriptional regulator [Allokutzneria oryzae]|uniref:Helix-turn-helix domain-containing protein n=1 Tax=Allokutzneria oryzae TaxID=1378989 RepID=A0ABV5ZSM8_9PSEU
MPGRRLTHTDRDRVAAGLAHGKGYAEIARELGRPTSTISREVARNGGPEHYRADHAQQAADVRASRRPPTTPPPRRNVTDDLEERFAEKMTLTGFPKMTSRVLVCLFSAGTGGRTAAELVRRLQVSPASVSKAISWLEQLSMVRRERDGRRERYVVDGDIWERAWLHSAESMRSWAEEAKASAALLDAETPFAARLTEMSQFFEVVHHDMMVTARTWRERVTH